MSAEEWRVVWKREGGTSRQRLFQREASARRLAALLRDPTIARPADNFEGESRQYEDWISRMKPIEYVRVDSRLVGRWGKGSVDAAIAEHDRKDAAE